MHPLIFLGLAAIFLIVVIGTRFVSMASVMAAFMFPFLIKWVAEFYPPMQASLHIATGCIAAVLVVLMHRENLKRIWSNQEAKIDFNQLKTKIKRKPKNPPEDHSND
jgi:glycerol-3-phosphate acyltransferase PlsY